MSLRELYVPARRLGRRLARWWWPFRVVAGDGYVLEVSSRMGGLRVTPRFLAQAVR